MYKCKNITTLQKRKLTDIYHRLQYIINFIKNDQTYLQPI